MAGSEPDNMYCLSLFITSISFVTHVGTVTMESSGSIPCIKRYKSYKLAKRPGSIAGKPAWLTRIDLFLGVNKLCCGL